MRWPRLRAALLASSVLTAGAPALPAAAQDAIWTPEQVGYNHLGDAGNWSTGQVPYTGTAYFGASHTTSLISQDYVSYDGWTFNADASNYFVAFASTITFNGAGIVINGGSLSFLGMSVVFNNSASAGSANFNNMMGYVYFNDNSTAANATLLGAIFTGNATPGNATIAGADFSGITGQNGDRKVDGSSATMSYILLGASELTLGTNNQSMTIDGSIEDGGAYGGTGGSLVKVGTGTLTLIHVAGSIGTTYNTYTGGTTIAAGTLQIGDGNTFGTISGDIVNNGALIFNTRASYSQQSYGGDISGTGTFEKTGRGQWTLSGHHTYTGATTISDGELQISGSLASSVINNNASLSYIGTATAGNATITNNRSLAFGNNATAGSATIISNGSAALYFVDNATAGNAQLIGTDASVVIDFSHSSGLGGKVSAGSMAGDGTYFLGSNELTVGGNNLTTSFNGVIAEGGVGGGANASLVKIGTGKLTLTGASTYTGATTINGGTLQIGNGGMTGSVLGNIVNNAALIFNHSNAYTFGGDISGSGTLEKQGAGTLTLSGANTYTGATTLSAGTLTANASNQFSAASATTIAVGGTIDLNGFMQTINTATLAGGTIQNGTLTGAITSTGGTVRNLGGSATLTTTSGLTTMDGVIAYSGATTINGGALVANTDISSSNITVNSGGMLGGIGTLGHTSINAGGVLAPGNSIGTINVNGNLTFNNGGIYAVEVSPTVADRTNVIGTATLTGATVQAVALPGSFRSQTYTIINATGGLGGTQFAGLTFSGASISPGARNPHLTYDANNVYLVLDPGTLPVPAGASGNQSNVAGAINTFVENGGTPPAAFDVLLNMSGPQLTSALNQVSGQPAGGAATSGTQMTTSFMTTMLNPFSGGSNSGGGALGYARGFGAGDTPKAAEAYAAVTPKDKQMMAASFDRRWSLWGSGYGGTNQRGGDTATGSADTSTRTYGFAAGADYRPAADWLVGFALAGGNTSWSLSQGLGGGKSDVFQIGAFASKAFGAAYVSGALSYAWHDVTTDRTVTVSGVDKLEARYHAHSFGARLEAGYRLLTPWLGVTPYAALQAQSFRTPSYGETAISGSNTFALAYSATTSKTLRTELGAWFDKSFALDSGDTLTLRSRAAWAHDHANDNGINAAFQTLPGSSFTVNGAAAPKNVALLSLGGEWQRGRVTLGARFDGEFADGSQSYSGTGSVRYAW